MISDSEPLRREVNIRIKGGGEYISASPVIRSAGTLMDSNIENVIRVRKGFAVVPLFRLIPPSSAQRRVPSGSAARYDGPNSRKSGGSASNCDGRNLRPRSR